MSALRFVAHGATLSLAWFVALNAAACAVVALTVRFIGRRGQTPAAAPGFWLALRLLPAGGSALFVALVFLPSYLKFEPRQGVEGFDVTLTLLAAAGVAVAAAAIVRGLAASRGASRRVHQWMVRARPLSLAGAPLPAFEVDADRPVIALSGVVRPRLLITRGLLNVLSDAELSASVAHEVGHQRALDNLKRLAMRAAPDLLAGSPAARIIEQRWASAAEHAADRLAGARDAAARCALASALVKVARLTPPVPPAAEPISTLIAGGDISSRVQQLLDDRETGATRASTTAGLGLAGLTAIGTMLVYSPLMRLVHEATEILVRTLP
jgi:Zn-dependent protease with chaperone function